MTGYASLLVTLFLVAAAMAAPAAPAQTTLYLEAERFAEVGGWTIDAQFRQQMGSAYLLAAGIGVPVPDATTKVAISAAGKYHLWVRCKDWDKTSPGAFQVLINGRPSAVAFGTQKKGWSWVSGGVFDLRRGPATLALHDLTGYYGRCDAIILTTDPALTPPDDVAAIAKLRERIIPSPAPVARDFDFVVVGGGYGGVCAAVQAARLGLKTALVQNRPVLGGNASKEINVGPGGASPHTSRFRETGICEEISEWRVHPACENWSDAMDRVVENVPNLSIFLNTEGVRAVMAGKGHIAAVEAENVVTGERTTFRAPLFADCTGDGDIAFSAGCEFRVGQEARAEFNESYAPETANANTMGTSIIHHSQPMMTEQPFTPPPFAVRFTAEHFQKRKQNLTQGSWWIEYGGLIDTIKDAEEIRDELIRVVFGAFDWAKNHDPEHREAAARYRLTWVPTVAGKRESRRFIGDYILTQGDVENAPVFPDRVAWGGWPIDLHPSVGIYGKEVPPYTPFRLKQPFSIPYRILYTKDVDNLFMAGRHVSVTHVALGSTRLMQTIGTMGQAVGAAAHLCRKHGVMPRAIYPSHIRELQYLLLRCDAYFPEPLTDDPGNLCRGAKATASSVAGAIVTRFGTEPRPSREAPCTMARGQTVVAAKPGEKSVSLYLANTDAAPTTAEVRVEKGSIEGGKTQPLWSVTQTVAPGGPRWVSFALPEALAPAEPYFVWVAPNPKLVWRICEGAPGERYYGKPGDWTRSEGLYALRPYGALAHLGDVSPAAAIDGLSWPEKGQGRQWRSDAEKGLPQWLEIDFGKPVQVNTVCLTFDTNIFGRFSTAQPGAEVTAQDYRVLVHSGGGWKVAFEEKGNRQRFRRHTFATATADKMRLEVLSAHGSKEARVYEVKAFCE